MEIFVSTLSQTAYLFAFIFLGYILGKFSLIPKDSATVLARLENLIFMPCLVMGTFIENFRVKRLATATNVLIASAVIIAIAIPIGILISKLLTKNKYLQNIYTYGLCFANFGFMGNAVVNVLFPDIFLEYIIFTLPLWIMIYVWAVPNLLMDDGGEKHTVKQRLKALTNPMFIAMLVGAVIGLIEIPIPEWAFRVVTVAGECMSPIAMMLTGITVSAISIRKTLSNSHIYILTFMRLVLIPAVFVLIGKLLGLSNSVFICALCALSMPLGLNTIVIPSAYGKDVSVAAGMAIISHFFSCITIPFLFLLVL